MTDIPIIFSAPMVRALLDSRKTMTRRLAWVYGRPSKVLMDQARAEGKVGVVRPVVPSPWQRVKPGHLLWVREQHWRWGRWYKDGKTKSGRQRWRFKPSEAPVIPIIYSEPTGPKCERETVGFHKRPSIFMPRWASRLTLVVTATKIERLQSIPLLDVRAEGCEVRHFWLFGADADGRQKIGANVFRGLWEIIHGHDAWSTNPEVVALTFTVHKQNIDALEIAA